jgi:hypothetical protein
MSESRVRGIERIAKRLCELYTQQVDTLRQGTLTSLAEGELKQYSDRKRLAGELHTALKKLASSIFAG